MKLIYKLFAVAASILALSSCVESAIGPMTGKYEKPVVYEMNTLASQSVEKGDKYRTFTVELTGDNASMTLKMVNDKYFLADGSYTPAPADQAKKNTYIVGNGGTTFNNIPVETGSIKVAQGEGTYSFAGMLWLADESVIEIKSTVALVYEADPEPVRLTTLLSATSNVASGTKSLTINLGTDGISSTTEPPTWQPVWTGTGNYLALDIYSADGYLHEGTYTASAAGGTINEGEFGIGWDPGDLWGIGMVFENWGTCWWDVADGAATINQKVTEGSVTVTRKGSKWVIELVSGEGKSMLWTKFEGAIDALTDPALGGGGNVDDTDYVELTKLLSATSNVANGTKSLTLNLGTDGISSTTDPTTWQTVWEGEGNYLALDIYSEDGKLYTGTYNACATAGTINEGEFGIGWDPGDIWNIGIAFENWGTCWWNVADGAAVAAGKVTDGTVQVLVKGTDLVIKLKSTLVNAKFTYPVAQFVDGTGAPIEVVNLGGGEGPEPAPDYTEFTKLLIVQPNQVYNESGQPTGEYSSFTLKVGTDGMYTEVVNNGWYDETKIKGTGQVLSIDFYTADGTVAAGTYTACEVGGTINEGEFGIGYDVETWGQKMVWGTCVTPYESDTAGTIEKVLDGTVTVKVSGDVYTITLESSNINAQYIGSLTL